MRLALMLAKRGLGQTWPNPAVGAVVVDAAHRQILGIGATGKGGRPHAEAMALAAAGTSAKGATLYVTLEPCSHHGMTPPCADAIAAANLAQVIYGVIDPDPRVSGSGIARLERHGIAARQGGFAAEAHWLTLGHILRIKHKRPFVQIKLAVGRDGLVPAGNAAPVWVTGSEARAYAHLLRAEADAIAVGSGTIRADDPQLTCRLPGMEWRSPVRVIFAGGGDVSPLARVFAGVPPVPVWLLHDAQLADAKLAPFRQRRAETFGVRRSTSGALCLADAMEKLAARGITRLLVEGGPRLAASFLEAGLADEVLIFHGTEAAGGSGLLPFHEQGLEMLANSPHYKKLGIKAVGGDAIHVYRHQNHLSDMEQHVHRACHGGRHGA